jgi:hypothetical protein
LVNFSVAASSQEELISIELSTMFTKEGTITYGKNETNILSLVNMFLYKEGTITYGKN